MNASKSRLCRARIQEPGYWRDRAIEMGEMYGIWLAEWHLVKRPDKDRDHYCMTKVTRYMRKMLWYADKSLEGLL